MPSVSELHRQELEADQLPYETEHRRPMTGYEGVSDERLIDVIFDPLHPTVNNAQLRRELKYRLIERGTLPQRVMSILDNDFGECAGDPRG